MKTEDRTAVDPSPIDLHRFGSAQGVLLS